MALPQWITSGDLGSYSEIYSFDINPLLIYYSADAPASVALINGLLPDGLSWNAAAGMVTITGESLGVAVDQLSQWTFRVTDSHGVVSDRTFTLRLVADILPPDWTGQSQFIGYVASGSTSAWTVHAISPQLSPVTYTIAMFTPPPGISIDAVSGLLTYSAAVVASDQTISFTLRATTGAVYSDLACNIQVLTVPHLPAWITGQGLIAELSEGEFLDTAIEAFDSSGVGITYTLASASPSFPFSLTPTGLIYGTVPILYVDTTYEFTINATNALGTVQRTFYVLATPITVSTALYWTNQTGYIGTVVDGQYTVLDVSAKSTRGVITHSITGGQLPLTLILDRQGGQLVGFMEYQLRDRPYAFDVTATDGVETITRTFYLYVIKGTNSQFMGLSIPLEGNLKDLYYDFIGTAIQPQWYALPSSTPQSVLTNPNITWIQGLNYSIDDPAAALGVANLYLNTTEVMIGAVTNVNVSPSSTLFYAPILDQDAGADASYAPVGGELAYTYNATVTIQTGTVIFGHVYPISYETPITAGTALRAYAYGDASRWMQGTVISFNGHSLHLDSTSSNGSGSSAAWQFFPAPIYPPSLENVRMDLINGLGWANDGQGSNAVLLPVVDIASTGISTVEVVYPGSGFLYPPDLIVSGSDNSAVLSSSLTVIGASIVDPGTGWMIGDVLTFSPPAMSEASMSVTSVDEQGGILELSVIDGGEYARWPAGPQLITHDAGLPARLIISCGLLSVNVISPGNAYVQSSTSVSTAGSEMLPSWQTSWSPYLPIGEVQAQYGGQVYGLYAPAGNVIPTYGNLTTTQSLIYYQRWPLQHAILELQGLNWTGDTSFDDTETQFDGGLTAFAEWTEPRDTIFDTDLEIFDGGNTRFDDDYAAWQAAAQRNWGLTEFDQDYTIFDLYATLFDGAGVTTHSITLLRRLLRIVTQQISGHDVVV